MRTRHVWLSVIVLLVSMVFAAPGRAAGFLEMNFYLSGPRYDALLPSCDAAGALGKIQARFGSKEGQYWNSDLYIVNFDKIRETAFRPWADDTVPRRFCSAQALVSDGKWHTVHYAIIEDGGMIGMTYGVEWCVVGFDRNWAYNPRCKMARP
jgi:hypothetical protein